jgi:ubiquinone/menaquinone biosynthesis C-methylase UbiE
MTLADTAELSAFRKFEHAGWKEVADGYDDHVSSLTGQAVQPLLKAAGVQAGMRLLDVCTGPGHAAAVAAELGAHATAIDFSLPMIVLARSRITAARFLTGDAEALPFRDGSFDAVISSFGLLHLTQPDQFLREAHRLLRRGGKAAFTVWTPAAEAVAFGMVHRAVQAHGDPTITLPPGPPFFRFSEAEECARSLRSAGFADPEVSRIDQVWRLKDSDGVFRAMMAGTVRTGGLLRAQAPEARAAIRESLREETERYRMGNRYELPMPAVLASAVKP